MFFSKFQRLKLNSRRNFRRKFKIQLPIPPGKDPPTALFPHPPLLSPRHFHRKIDSSSSLLDNVPTQPGFPSTVATETSPIQRPVSDFDEAPIPRRDPDVESVAKVQNLLKIHRDDGSAEQLERALDQCGLPPLTENLVLSVLRRHRADWRLALSFFKWVCKGGQRRRGYAPGSGACNEILDILGRMKRFAELAQVLDEMSEREGVVDEATFGTLIHRHAAAHRVEEAIGLFHRRKEFGLLEPHSGAFHKLLMSLCRYKHVEAAEDLFLSKQQQAFPQDVKARNIILNGWRVRGNLREARRFWADTIASGCEPDAFTYGALIHSMTKAGKLAAALRLFRSMRETGCPPPDATICNCIIDALCFKKRIPEALEIFGAMDAGGECPANAATYNSLIKHLCKIGRMEKVYELLDGMERRKGSSCAPNARTYGYLLKSARGPEEVPRILERMERNGCKMTSDLYNLVLKLYMGWDEQEKVRSTWVEMESNGFGPDQRSYTIMVHGLCDKERVEDALRCYGEMAAKGMAPEPRTELLVNAMNLKLKEKDGRTGGGRKDMGDAHSSSPSPRRARKKEKFC